MRIPQASKASPRPADLRARRLTRAERRALKLEAKKPTTIARRQQPGRRKLAQYARSTALDIEALSQRPRRAWETLILDFEDWLQARACRHNLEQQLAAPCGDGDDPDNVEQQARRAASRARNTGRALEREHERCLDGKVARRPGAPRSLDSCSGCIFSYPEPTEADDALLDAMGAGRSRRAREEAEQLRQRVRALGAWCTTGNVLPDVSTRRADLPHYRHAPDWANYPAGDIGGLDDTSEDNKRLDRIRLTLERRRV